MKTLPERSGTETGRGGVGSGCFSPSFPCTKNHAQVFTKIKVIRGKKEAVPQCTISSKETLANTS